MLNYLFYFSIQEIVYYLWIIPFILNRLLFYFFLKVTLNFFFLIGIFIWSLICLWTTSKSRLLIFSNNIWLHVVKPWWPSWFDLRSYVSYHCFSSLQILIFRSCISCCCSCLNNSRSNLFGFFSCCSDHILQSCRDPCIF